MTSLSRLPDDSRVWVFGADRALTDSEISRVESSLGDFLTGWAAHGAPLRTAHEVVERRFVVVAVDERPAGASGCSIDALSRQVADLGRVLDVDLLGGNRIWYRDGDDIVCCDRAEFRERAATGDVTADTPVFDPTVAELGDVRDGRFERSAGSSWHARLLPSTGVAGGA